VTATDLPDAPAIVRSTSAAPASLPGIVSNQQAPPPPPKAVSNTPTPAASTPAVVGGQLRGAEVISRVDPEYPKLARQAGASGLVELEATIGVDGKVKNPHVVKGNSMLQRAAIDAVLQWRYKPATLNGKPVESPVDIKLNFVPQR
jgi:protein TonB